MINSRNLDDLEPQFRAIVDDWMAECENEGIPVAVVCTFRDDEYQNWLYASGRTREGKILTQKRGGESMHNKRKALDFGIRKAKAIDWQDTASYTRAGLIAERLGLVWSGRWNGRMKELGHIEAQK